MLWLVLQKLIRVFYRVKFLRDDGNGIICIKLRRYSACPVTLDDGTEIKAGDRIIELHLNNTWFKKRRKLKQIKASSLPWEAFHCFAQDLSFLARQIADGMFDRVTALHGVTLLHGVARRLGFQVDELPDTLWKKGVEFYIGGLMQIYYLGVTERFKTTGRPLELKGVWLSRADLLRRYSA
ncbi:hypothetical protein ACFLU4_04470 [Chloroflexota bacterium]